MSDIQDNLRKLSNSVNYQEWLLHMESQNHRFSQLDAKTKLISYYLLVNNKLDDLYGSLGDIIFERKPVSIQEFIESPDYLGNIVNKTLRPKWREELYEFFKTGSSYCQAIFSGSIGTGKSFISRLMALYTLYRVCCLRNPQAVFSFSKESSLGIAMLSVTMEKAHRVSLRPFAEILASCPAFEKVKSIVALNKYRGTKIPFVYTDSDARLTFRNNVYVIIGSQLSHLVGFNLFGGILDEAELAGNSVEEVLETFNELTTRIYSRFKKSAFTHSNIISSAGFSNGVIQQYIESVSDRFDKDTKLYEYTMWELFPSIDPFANGHFYVVKGGTTFPSTILEDSIAQLYLDEKKELPRNCELVKIPLEHLPEFKKDIDKALRDIAGKVTNGSEVPFPDASVIIDDNLCPLVSIETYKDDPIPFFDKLPKSLFITDSNGTIKMKRAMKAKRYSHLDLALVSGSTTAISVVHKELGDTGETFYVTDFIIKIQTTDILKVEKILDLYKDLKYKAGILFESITADQFQSVSLLQRIEDLRIANKVSRLSLDTTANPFKAVAALVSQGVVKTGRNPELITQLEATQINPNINKRIKDKRQSKYDLAEAMVGANLCAYNTYNDIPTYRYEQGKAINSNLNPNKINSILSKFRAMIV